MRADEMPCEDVAVYCIGCVRAMQSGGKKPHHLLDLMFAQKEIPMLDTLHGYHSKLEECIKLH